MTIQLPFHCIRTYQARGTEGGVVSVSAKPNSWSLNSTICLRTSFSTLHFVQRSFLETLGNSGSRVRIVRRVSL